MDRQDNGQITLIHKFPKAGCALCGQHAAFKTFTSISASERACAYRFCPVDKRSYEDRSLRPFLQEVILVSMLNRGSALDNIKFIVTEELATSLTSFSYSVGLGVFPKMSIRQRILCSRASDVLNLGAGEWPLLATPWPKRLLAWRSESCDADPIVRTI
jgi:hypothetical protein